MTDTLTAEQLAEIYVGKRVQIPTYHDLWMMGDRYGVITSVRHSKSMGPVVGVTLDRSHRVVRFVADEILSRTID